jgi:hypothetical protein
MWWKGEWQVAEGTRESMRGRLALSQPHLAVANPHSWELHSFLMTYSPFKDPTIFQYHCIDS